MKAKDLMVTLQECLGPDMTLRDAVRLLKTTARGEQAMGLNGLPVLDPNGKLIGMLSTSDVLKAVHPAYLDMMDLGDFTWDGMLESLAKKAGDSIVKNCMTKEIITVGLDKPLMDCVDHLIKNKITRLPVVDNTGKVIGMLYEQDIFNVITRAMFDEQKRGSR
jgi:predicted transcriptional regulator